MSNDTRTTSMHAPAMEVHYCEHPGCKKRAAFGFARINGDPIRWSCWEHFPYKTMEDLSAAGDREATLDKALGNT